jgi:hypothetical protein
MVSSSESHTGIEIHPVNEDNFLADKEDFAGEWSVRRGVSNPQSGGGAKIVGDYSTIGDTDV